MWHKTWHKIWCTFSKLLSILNVPASTNQATFPLYSLLLCESNYNFVPHVQQKQTKIYEVIALFTQFPEAHVSPLCHTFTNVYLYHNVP